MERDFVRQIFSFFGSYGDTVRILLAAFDEIANGLGDTL